MGGVECGVERGGGPFGGYFLWVLTLYFLYVVVLCRDGVVLGIEMGRGLVIFCVGVCVGVVGANIVVRVGGCPFFGVGECSVLFWRWR